MRTSFSPAQLADPHLADAERSIRTCVHCGICTASCPTYALLGDERDGPRGRIVMMQQMLEEDRAPSAEAVKHVDRCLSCLACRTACPSSVDYARLVDAARSHIQARYQRPFAERLLRWLIARVMTRPALVRIGLILAPLGTLLPGRLGAMARLGTKSKRRAHATEVASKPNARRVALMPGCVQKALAPEIDAATRRVLARRGTDLVPLTGAGCCGSLVHHLGRSDEAKAWARRAIQAFEAEGPFEAVLITATGCSAHLKDFAHLFAGDPEWAPRATAFAAKACDFLELVEADGAHIAEPLRVAWQAPCSLTNGLKLAAKGRKLLQDCGYEVVEVPEECCGSAGTYSILQPELAGALRARKLAAIALLRADVVATANIGCLHHLSGEDAPPVVHLAELVDRADAAEGLLARDAPLG